MPILHILAADTAPAGGAALDQVVEASGRVDRKLAQPGAFVKADTALLELSNPQLQQETLNAEWDWKASEKSYMDLKVRLESQQLNQEADAARVQADYNQAKLRLEANSELAKQGLVPELTVKLDKVTVEELGNRLQIERKRLEINKESTDAQLAVQKARVEQLRAVYELRKSQLDQLAVDVGQSVIPGSNLARVADPTHLKAELKIAETQAKDVQIGQTAEIDTRNGVIPGHVIRKDPAVQNGTVTVDVALDSELPKGAVPDLSVDGTIELERLQDIIYVGRPVQGQPNSLVTLFKLEADGREAIRVQVKLGRSSVNTIEIMEGLKPGDQVVLSDMSAQDAFNRIRLN